MKPLASIGAALVFTAASAAFGQDPLPSAESLESAYPGRPYSPYASRNFPTQPYWGDTHVHTSYSMDAGAFGARLDMNDAYRFARGEEVVSSTGLRVKLSRPLDFLVVADHSDNMGFFPKLYAGDPEFLADPTGRRHLTDARSEGSPPMPWVRLPDRHRHVARQAMLDQAPVSRLEDVQRNDGVGEQHDAGEREDGQPLQVVIAHGRALHRVPCPSP